VDTNLIMPKVSVIMSTYNDAQYLQTAIESVLCQSFSDLEFIIVNDGSSDNTIDLINNIKDDRIIFINNEKQKGLIKNLNTALVESRGRYIARIDSDDIWIDKNKLNKQINFLNGHSEYGLIGTAAMVYNENEKFLFHIANPSNDENIRSQILSKNCFVHSSVVFKKELAYKCNMYSFDNKYVEDYGLWLEIGKKCKFANLPDICVYYRLRQYGETQRHNLAQIRNSIYLAEINKNYYPGFYFAYFRWKLKELLVYFKFLRLINLIKNYFK